jgi:high-affinity iron transporter
MLATAIIVFREVLEAALIVGIVMAASRGAAGRGFWVGGGIVGGVLGALGVAAAAGTIAAMAEGMGQELFDAAILFAAVLMLGWHNVWMVRHGRDLATNATQLGQDVRSGAQPLWALAFAVGLAVLREGSETVLFLTASRWRVKARCRCWFWAEQPGWFSALPPASASIGASSASRCASCSR